jgi:hypothetical protein
MVFILVRDAMILSEDPSILSSRRIILASRSLREPSRRFRDEGPILRDASPNLRERGRILREASTSHEEASPRFREASPRVIPGEKERQSSGDVLPSPMHQAHLKKWAINTRLTQKEYQSSFFSYHEKKSALHADSIKTFDDYQVSSARSP